MDKLPFKIGDKVIVSGTAIAKYNERSQRQWLRFKMEDTEAYYVGYTYKQEGTIHSEGGGYNFHGKYDYESSYLSISKTVLLARIKFNDRSNDSFVFPSDIRKVSSDG